MVLFIGNYTDIETYEIITKNRIRDLSQAARLFQERLILSLYQEKKNIRFISVLPSTDGVPIGDRIDLNGIEITSITYNSRKIDTLLKAVFSIKKIIQELPFKEERLKVIMYAINPIALLPLLQMRRKYNLELITICPELPSFRRYKNTMANRVKRVILKCLNRKFDKYILFAESMKDYIPRSRKYMVIEGFAPDRLYAPQKKERNIAMYAGGLAADNGIKLMIDVAEKSESLEELWICGIGDCKDFVEENTSKKVKYLGKLENSQVIELERKAKVLLNLRDPGDPITRFSFPSKVLEYMASGTMVLSTKLSGISKEYYDYIASVEEYTIESVINSLEMIFDLDDDKYLEMTERASEFIKSKTSVCRVKELLMFVGDNQ